MDKAPQESSIAAAYFAKRHRSFVISEKSLACDEIGCTWRGCPHHEHFWDPELTSRQSVVSYQRLVIESQSGGGPAGSGAGCPCCQMLRDILENVCECMLNSLKSRNLYTAHACIELWIWTYGGDGREFDLEARWVCGFGYLDLRRRRLALGEDSPMKFVKMISHSSSSLLTAECNGKTRRDDLCSNVDLAQCRSWLNDCDRNHDGCAQSKGLLQLPSRLLLATKGRLVLQETAKLPSSGIPYIALSYCWGGKDPAKTLRSNYQNRARGVSIAMLPRTYRQAIYLARQLGIHHIWIDALCIVQDDRQDWQRESSRMAEIYSGAYIVFVAAAAADVEGGLDPSADLKDWRYLTEHQIRAGSMWVRFKDHKPDACAFLPIATRAWTYQERRLAKRCLIFGESEVVWECRQGCRCPCFGAQTVVRQSQPQLLPSVPGTAGRHFASNQDAYRFWCPVVHIFSKMQLTRPTDRLPAISAIASVIQAVTGDQYLAGLWRSGLLLQLAWRPDGNWSRQDSPYRAYIAPSWSWASFPGAALLMHPGQVEEFQAENAEILDARCKPVNLCSPLGAVHHGTLTLRGLCVRATVEQFRGNSPAHYDKLSIINNKSEFHVALRLDYSRKPEDTFRDDPPQMPSEAHVMPRTRVVNRGMPETPVQLLYLTRNIFLVLSKSRRKHGVFFRLGILSLSDDLVNRDEAYMAEVRKQLFSAANREEVVVI